MSRLNIITLFIALSFISCKKSMTLKYTSRRSPEKAASSDKKDIMDPLDSPESISRNSCLQSGGNFTAEGTNNYEVIRSSSYTVYLPKLAAGCKTHLIGFAMGTGHRSCLTRNGMNISLRMVLWWWILTKWLLVEQLYLALLILF